jgi:hypothetical protein
MDVNSKRLSAESDMEATNFSELMSVILCNFKRLVRPLFPLFLHNREMYGVAGINFLLNLTGFKTATIMSKQKTQKKKHEGKRHRNKTQMENMQSITT